MEGRNRFQFCNANCYTNFEKSAIILQKKLYLTIRQTSTQCFKNWQKTTVQGDYHHRLSFYVPGVARLDQTTQDRDIFYKTCPMVSFTTPNLHF